MDMENNNVVEETVVEETVVEEQVLEHAEGEVLGVENEEQNNSGKVMSIVSLVVGIVSILLLCASYCIGTVFPLIGVLPLITSIVGVVLGIVGVKKSTESKGLAIAGIIVSVIALVISIPLVGCAACSACACLGGIASSATGY